MKVGDVVMKRFDPYQRRGTITKVDGCLVIVKWHDGESFDSWMVPSDLVLVGF